MPRILLLVDHRENSRLLEEILAKSHVVKIADNDGDLDDRFDLCIIDGPALDRAWSRADTRRTLSDPLFLPILLLTSRQEIGISARHLLKAVDEIILTPIEEVELLTRVEMLLRTRELSIESEQGHFTLSRQCPVGILIISEGKIVYSNPYFTKVTGSKPDDSSLSDFLACIHPDDAEKTGAFLRGNIESRACRESLEIRFIAGEDIVWGLLRTTAILHQGKPALLTIIEDITEHTRSNIELARARSVAEDRAKELDTIFSAMTVAMMVYDSHGITVKVTPMAEWLFGFNPIGMTLDILMEKLSIRGLDDESISPEDFPWAKALRGETVMAQRLFLTNPKDRGFHLLASAAPIPLGENRFGAVCVFHDLTEQESLLKRVRNYADELTLANAQLQEYYADMVKQGESLRRARDELELRVQERTRELSQSNQALQDFVAIASHDMKEPLRKVISFGNMIRERYGDSFEPTANDYLRRMMDATRRMQNLLDSLLQYSRVTINPEPFRTVDLSALLSDALSDLEISIRKTGGEVHIQDMPVIEADPSQMRQLFQNLIGNALKFHKPGEKPIVNVCVDQGENHTLKITVEDKGIGFEQEHVDRIFAPFRRLHGRSSQYEGTGMGLAICKKIVERHGGSITAKSTPGKGATFILKLPQRVRSEG